MAAAASAAFVVRRAGAGATGTTRRYYDSRGGGGIPSLFSSPPWGGGASSSSSSSRRMDGISNNIIFFYGSELGGIHILSFRNVFQTEPNLQTLSRRKVQYVPAGNFFEWSPPIEEYTIDFEKEQERREEETPSRTSVRRTRNRAGRVLPPFRENKNEVKPTHHYHNIIGGYRRVILKIRPLSYFHDGHRMSPQRSSNTPSRKPGYFGGSCSRTVVRFYDLFFVRGLLGVGNLYDRD